MKMYNSVMQLAIEDMRPEFNSHYLKYFDAKETTRLNRQLGLHKVNKSKRTKIK